MCYLYLNNTLRKKCHGYRYVDSPFRNDICDFFFTISQDQCSVIYWTFLWIILLFYFHKWKISITWNKHTRMRKINSIISFLNSQCVTENMFLKLFLWINILITVLYPQKLSIIINEEDWSTQKLRNLPEVTKLVNSRASKWMKVVWLQSSMT